MTVPALKISGLQKSFGGVIATDNVNLTIERGETHAVIGPNGAGKTTLISQISGALRPDAGTITLAGEEITGFPAYRRSHLGLARSFQITSVFSEMSVLDNVAMAVQAHDGHSFRFWKRADQEAALREPALTVLGRVGLGERADERTGSLSHGEKRQLEIAMALATRPALLLLDEPTAGMGAEESARMIELIQSLKGEKTILLVEHDMDAVFKLADRISVLVYGKVIGSGAPEEIRNDEAVKAAYLGEEAA